MFKVTKRIEISSSHKLDLPYESKCKNLHGHNWIIEVEVSSEHLNHCGMIMDFVQIKGIVNQLDHKNINEIVITDDGLPINPTAENIAKWIANNLIDCLNDTWQENFSLSKNPVKVTKITVQESEGNVACYIP